VLIELIRWHPRRGVITNESVLITYLLIYPCTDYCVWAGFSKSAGEKTPGETFLWCYGEHLLAKCNNNKHLNSRRKTEVKRGQQRK
jgi:hypothetical protein